MMHDLIGMGLMAILFVLVVVSLVCAPSVTAPVMARAHVAMVSVFMGISIGARRPRGCLVLHTQRCAL